MTHKVYARENFEKLPYSHFWGCLFVECAFSRETFQYLHFDSCSFINCNLTEGVNISKCGFSNCSFSNIYIDYATFTENCFSECTLSNLSLRAPTNSRRCQTFNQFWRKMPRKLRYR